jgi:hypothetical protein
MGSILPMCWPVSQLMLVGMNKPGHWRTAMPMQTDETRIAPRAGVSARLSARLRSHQLDEALARGMPPESAAPLALRARRLTALSRRRAIARGLRRVIRDTCRGGPPSRARISPRRAQVIGAADKLTELADALATPGPVPARGVAQAFLLLTDGTGPLYDANNTANLGACAAIAAGNLRLEE